MGAIEPLFCRGHDLLGQQGVSYSFPDCPPYIVADPTDKEYVNILVFEGEGRQSQVAITKRIHVAAFPRNPQQIQPRFPQIPGKIYAVSHHQYPSLLHIYINDQRIEHFYFCTRCCHLLVEDGGSYVTHATCHEKTLRLLPIVSPMARKHSFIAFLLRHYVPLSSVDDYLVKYFAPETPSYKTLIKELTHLQAQTMKAVSQEIAEADFVVFEIDGVSKMNRSFVGFLCRYFTKNLQGLYMIRNVLLEIANLSDHTATSVAQKAVDLARALNCQDKIVACTMDGAVVNEATVSEMSQLLGVVIYFDRCRVHRIALIFKQFFNSEVPGCKNIIPKLELLVEVAKYLHYSHGFQVFRAIFCQEADKVPKTVKTPSPTRFITQANVVQSLLDNRPIIEQFIQEDSDFLQRFNSDPISDADWSNMKFWAELLNSFLECVTTMECDTSDLGKHSVALTKLCLAVDSARLSQAFQGRKTQLGQLLAELKSLWTKLDEPASTLLAAGAILFPREGIPQHLREATTQMNKVATLICKDNSAALQEYFSFLDNHLMYTPMTDPVSFWFIGVGLQRYPNLAAEVRRFLVIPGHSMTLERANSCFGRTFTRDRNALRDDNVSLLTFLNFNQDFTFPIYGVTQEQLQAEEIRFRDGEFYHVEMLLDGQTLTPFVRDAIGELRRSSRYRGTYAPVPMLGKNIPMITPMIGSTTTPVSEEIVNSLMSTMSQPTPAGITRILTMCSLMQSPLPPQRPSYVPGGTPPSIPNGRTLSPSPQWYGGMPSQWFDASKVRESYRPPPPIDAREDDPHLKALTGNTMIHLDLTRYKTVIHLEIQQPETEKAPSSPSEATSFTSHAREQYPPGSAVRRQTLAEIQALLRPAHVAYYLSNNHSQCFLNTTVMMIVSTPELVRLFDKPDLSEIYSSIWFLRTRLLGPNGEIIHSPNPSTVDEEGVDLGESLFNAFQISASSGAFSQSLVYDEQGGADLSEFIYWFVDGYTFIDDADPNACLRRELREAVTPRVVSFSRCLTCGDRGTITESFIETNIGHLCLSRLTGDPNGGDLVLSVNEGQCRYCHQKAQIITALQKLPKVLILRVVPDEPYNGETWGVPRVIATNGIKSTLAGAIIKPGAHFMYVGNFGHDGWIEFNGEPQSIDPRAALDYLRKKHFLDPASVRNLIYTRVSP